MDDRYYLKQAIENSKKSDAEGNFPAGGIVVRDNNVLSSEVSSPYPGLFHADSKALTTAFNIIGPLTGATLYVGLQPCLMCIGVAYWSGIRRIVYAIPKSKVNPNYYETPEDTTALIQSFNEKIELIYLQELEQEAMNIIKQWEMKNNF